MIYEWVEKEQLLNVKIIDVVVVQKSKLGGNSSTPTIEGHVAISG